MSLFQKKKKNKTLSKAQNISYLETNFIKIINISTNNAKRKKYIDYFFNQVKTAVQSQNEIK